MKLVIQRAKEASVTVGGDVISRIGRGLLLLVGIHESDSAADAQFLAKKVLTLKLWDGEDGRPWQRSVVESGYDVLSVSNFTLFGLMTKPRPDFHRSMKSEQSRGVYQMFLEHLSHNYQSDRVFDGEFGAMMDVGLVNDGPITLILDSKDFAGAVDNFRPKSERGGIHASSTPPLSSSPLPETPLLEESGPPAQ